MLFKKHEPKFCIIGILKWLNHLKELLIRGDDRADTSVVSYPWTRGRYPEGTIVEPSLQMQPFPSSAESSFYL